MKVNLKNLNIIYKAIVFIIYLYENILTKTGGYLTSTPSSPFLTQKHKYTPAHTHTHTHTHHNIHTLLTQWISANIYTSTRTHPNTLTRKHKLHDTFAIILIYEQKFTLLTSHNSTINWKKTLCLGLAY